MHSDTLMASFVVALFSSFLTALAVLLVRTMAITVLRFQTLADLILNIYILFFFAGFVFFKGSSVAAWLLYRHDVAWGYELNYRKILPIFFTSLIIALVVYFAILFYIKSELPLLSYLHQSSSGALNRVRSL